MRFVTRLTIALITLHLSLPCFAAMSFQGISDLPGGIYFSQANDISSDGTVVVGSSSSDEGEQAIVWTNAGGMIGLGITGGQSLAHGASSDGTTVVGWSRNLGAVRWIDGNRSVIAGVGNNMARDVTPDGSVIVGGHRNGLAYRWTGDLGIRLGTLGGSYRAVRRDRVCWRKVRPEDTIRPSSVHRHARHLVRRGRRPA